ncbi:glycine-rich domain-containing protein [Streptomyces sp. NBC_00986]|uniref:glycine-rich domain-containing protein n=1 Tax=Streptomyces sp. NBC_00986 TaxID=2903702 RepID=UPI003866ED2A|nr:hypothetical protein OG504_33050 [Streptomyces sp. NBC_00986]
MTAALGVATERLNFETTSDYRQLVSPELFDRLVGRIVKDEDLERGLAERIMESALGFLHLSTTQPGRSFSPSPLVDIGWHTFILYTSSYADFCQRLAGRFIHHEPNDKPDAPQKPGGIKRSIDAFRAARLPVDQMLWTGHVTRKKLAAVLADGADITLNGGCSVDCDDGQGGPGDECTCS